MIGKHWSEHMDNQDDNDQFDAMRDEINALKAQPVQPAPLTDAELTDIYNRANGVASGKRQPITTQAIFKAMRAMRTGGAG